MSDLSPESRALLGLEGPLDEPSPADLDVRREAIFRALGVPPPAALPTPADVATPPEPVTPELSSPGPTVSTPVTGPAAWPVGMKLAFAFAAVGVLVAGAMLLAPRAEDSHLADDPSVALGEGPDTGAGGLGGDDALEAPPPPEAIDDETALEPGAPPRDISPGLPVREPGSGHDGDRQPTPNEVTPELPVQIEAPTPPEPTSATDELAPDPLSEESMLVAAGEAQLRAGQAANALTLFDRALARHPRGTLRVEALAGRALALCRSGRTDAGQREAERFLASYPRSPSAPRIREACGVTVTP